MPYSVGGSNLPSNVKKMDKKGQAQWVAVFNQALKDGKDESAAFKLANGVAKKSVDVKDYYDDLYEAAYKKLSQDDANYDAVGMKDGMACASCHWFISPESCALVQGDISPTGLSKFYMKAQPADPYTMPVTIVEPNDSSDDDAYTMPMMGKSNEGNIITAVLNGVKAMLRPTTVVKSEGVEGSALQFISCKDAAGDIRLRFMAVVSNNFQDREGEIIPEAAHQEYVDWATKEDTYPELWLWHSGPLSRWGQADWLDVSDGFLVASGLVDKGFEYIAHNLEVQAKAGNPSGVSHGFLCAKSNGTIGPYRSFELSPLPYTAAANEWTGFHIMGGENMAFTQQKRDWLKSVGGISDDTITTLESAMSNVAKSLKERGIEYKDMGVDVLEVGDKTAPKVAAVKLSPLDAAISSITGIKERGTGTGTGTGTVTEPTKPATPTEKPSTPVVPPHAPVQQPQPGAGTPQTPNPQAPETPPKEGGSSAGEVSSKEFTTLTARLDAQNETITQVGAAVKELTEAFRTAIVSLSQSDDEKTASFFKARADALPRGYQASESDSNTNTPLVKQLAADAQNQQKNGWFSDTVLKGLTVE